MSAPFFKLGYFGDEFSLIVAVLIGVVFGFILEQAGFGNARKLAAQFYFTDMAVFKVMFTGIVTAMLGIFFLGWIGFLDISLIYMSPTRLPSQVVGGLLLGVGFVVGGYCPGTSVVGAATGRVDAWVYILGVMAGILVFGEAYPWISDFYHASDIGSVTLMDYFHLSYGLVILAVVVMALVGFVGAEWLEKRLARRAEEG